MQHNSLTQTKEVNKASWKSRIKQMGVVAFLFFFIKGLVWIAIFLGLGSWIKNLF